MEALFQEALVQVKAIDASLVKTTEAEKVKAIKSLDYIESKLRKSIKQRESSSLARLEKISEKYFPSNGLQERHDNILEYMSMYGEDILEKMLPHCNPFEKSFKVFLMQPEDL